MPLPVDLGYMARWIEWFKVTRWLNTQTTMNWSADAGSIRYAASMN